MKKLIADISRKPDGGLRSRFYCQEADGQLDQAVSHTLLLLITESPAAGNAELEALVSDAEAGCYVPREPSLPDWGVNDKNVWLVPPMAVPGHICISNENTGEYSTEEGGQPQQFSYEQFHAALKHWREFRTLIDKEGKENLVGRRYEAALPDRPGEGS